MYYIIKTVKGNFYAEAKHELTIEEATRAVKSPVLGIQPISEFIYRVMTF